MRWSMHICRNEAGLLVNQISHTNLRDTATCDR